MFYDFLLTDGFASIFKLFLLLFGKFEDKLLGCTELKQFIDCFNRELDYFKEYGWLREAMGEMYLHLELFNKVRNTLIGEREEQLLKKQRMNGSDNQCRHELPYCFTARAARSLKGENFQVRVAELLEGLSAVKFVTKEERRVSVADSLPVIPPLPQSSRRLKAYTELNGTERENEPVSEPQKHLSVAIRDAICVVNDPRPKFTKHLSLNRPETVTNPPVETVLDPEASHAHDRVKNPMELESSPEDKLLIVRCEHICKRTAEDLMRLAHREKVKQNFFSKCKKMLCKTLGNHLEGLLVDNGPRTMKIMKNIGEVDFGDIASEKDIATEPEGRFRAKSLYISTSKEHFDPSNRKSDFSDTGTEAQERQLLRKHSLALEKKLMNKPLGNKKRKSLDEFKVEEYFRKYQFGQLTVRDQKALEPEEQRQFNGKEGVNKVH